MDCAYSDRDLQRSPVFTMNAVEEEEDVAVLDL